MFYYSTFLNSIVDLGVIDPKNCMSVKHCVKSESGYIMFVLDDTEYVSVNIVPMNSSNKM